MSDLPPPQPVRPAGVPTRTPLGQSASPTATSVDAAVAATVPQAPAAAPEPTKDPAAAAAEVAALAAEAAPAEAQAPKPKMFPLRDQEFELVPKLPGITVINLGLAGDPSQDDFTRLRAIHDVLDVAVAKKDRSRFQAFLRYAEPVIGIEELDGVIADIVVAVTTTPT